MVVWTKVSRARAPELKIEMASCETCLDLGVHKGAEPPSRTEVVISTISTNSSFLHYGYLKNYVYNYLSNKKASRTSLKVWAPRTLIGREQIEAA